jgi:hypothetical protein
MRIWEWIVGWLSRNPRKRIGVSVSVELPAFSGPNTQNRDLQLRRTVYTDVSTIGDLIDTDEAKRLCYTLEDTVRRAKEYGTTAIPAGRYEIVMKEFRNTGKLYPHFLNVPFYEGIFIHAGNTAMDSLGCPLVGMRYGNDVVYDSNKALNEIVIPRIRELLSTGRLWISVFGGYAPEEWERRHA